MNQKKILHVMVLEKFLAPFIDFVDEHFGREEHHYVFITSEKYQYGLTPQHHVEFLHTDDDIFITLLKYMKTAKKIILHGLWRDKVDLVLYSNQELLQKCYWIMWGGDFYFPEKQTRIRHEIIQKMGFYINGTEGDIKYIQEYYNAQGKYIEGIINYPSNVFSGIKKQLSNKLISTKGINLLVGNSATQTNNHKEIFANLKIFKNQDISIIVPLSYGDENYKDEIIKLGTEIFQDKIIFLTEMLPYDKYIELLSGVDIAIFGHDRQQATGNIVQLLGFGKKVYLNKESTLYEYFTQKGFKIFDFKNIDIGVLPTEVSSQNQELAKQIYSSQNLQLVLESYLT